MFGDPLDIVIDSATIHLPRISPGEKQSTYSNPDGTYAITISQGTTGKGRLRHTVRLDVKKIVTNPIGSTEDYDSSSLQFSIDRPGFGFTVGDIDALRSGLAALMNTAFITKLYGRET
ncbi:coat protein [ssRNA phage Gephyllon.3_6]|uniref:Coat protein n=2 Tax=Leviviricetes TaxID=2842243 RepID=A0A8S5L1M0_9VIRU|nr:coat protein [ssRNA phage Gephyllon.3_6]QDH87464.1 MAG: hypothetical protein H3BulkLitter171064_000002 [Leviviridae sp.]DAD51327.1 TPA_asm: coat protein [ssRNA phage Gephyllon.3_6]